MLTDLSAGHLDSELDDGELTGSSTLNTLDEPMHEGEGEEEEDEEIANVEGEREEGEVEGEGEGEGDGNEEGSDAASADSAYSRILVEGKYKVIVMNMLMSE